MTLREYFDLTPDDLEDLLRDQERELDELRAEIERRGSPAGNPQGCAEAGTSRQDPCPAGPLEHPIVCARCGRELHSLEQIRAALEFAPGEALERGRAKGRVDRYSFAFGYLTQAVAEAIRDLSCHSGACHRGML